MTAHDPRIGPNARLLAADSGIPRTGRTPLGQAAAVSVLVHAVVVTVAAIVAAQPPKQRENPRVAQDTAQITWIAQPSVESDVGGGGSGKRTPAPARAMQRPGTEAIALPTKPPPTMGRIDTSAIAQPLELPAMPTNAGVNTVPGVITTLTSLSVDSEGPGTGDRQGSGRGPGLGPGDGAGVGPGRNDGPGGGGYRVGNGVTTPRLIYEVKPAYTGEAMRARIQGIVRMQAIVLSDGSVGNMKILKSLDHTFGLDEEALKTVRQWRFQPGMLAGRAVPVLIEVELAFTLR
jgi:periplasmic protein TonB